jgi:hypothetical protein
MARMGKYLCLCLVGISVISSLLAITPVYAQTSPKLITPEFTVQYNDSSYNDSNSFRQNKTIVLTIENQFPVKLFRSYPEELIIGLYYNISSKRSNETNWFYFPTYTALNNWSYISSSFLANYTVLNLIMKGDNDTSIYSSTAIHWLQEAPPGETIDFRVQAYRAYFYQIRNPAPFSPAPGYKYYIDIQKIVEESDWSPVQSITIPGPTPSPSPPQTTPISETLLLVVLPIIFGVMAITVILILRKLKTKN